MMFNIIMEVTGGDDRARSLCEPSRIYVGRDFRIYEKARAIQGKRKGTGLL